MMQKGDYNMAYVSFNLSCQILENHLYGDLDFEEGSREAQDSNTDKGIKKFVLACRQFQKGLANFAILRATYTNRNLLDNDFDLP